MWYMDMIHVLHTADTMHSPKLNLLECSNSLDLIWQKYFVRRYFDVA
jgi:hypothetical protein